MTYPGYLLFCSSQRSIAPGSLKFGSERHHFPQMLLLLIYRSKRKCPMFGPVSGCDIYIYIYLPHQ